MNEIKEFLEQKIENLVRVNNEKIIYLEQIKHSNINGSLDFCNIVPEEMLTILACIYENIEDPKNTQNIYKQKLELIRIDKKLAKIIKIFRILEKFSKEEKEQIKVFVERNKSNNYLEKLKLMFNLFLKLKENSNRVKELFKIITITGISTESFNDISNLLEFYNSLNLDIRTNFINYLNIYELGIRYKNNNYRNKLKSYSKFIADINKYYNQKLNECKNEIKNYRHLLNNLTLKEGKYIFLSNEYYEKLSSDFLIELMYKINNYNLNLCENLKQENTQIKGFEINEIFIEYGIKNRLTEKDKEYLINNRKIIELKKIISALANITRKIDISNQNLIEILLNTTTEKVEKIKKVLLLNLIDYKFLSEHLNVFTSPDNEILIKNFEIIQSIFYKGNNLNEILLNSEFEKYINLAKKYGLNIQEEVVLKNISKPYFFDALDIFIEDGLYDIILNNSDILNYDLIKIIKRIKIAEKLKINIYDNKKSFNTSIIEGTNFCISDEMLDYYIFNIVPFKINPNNKEILDNHNRLDCSMICKLDELFEIEDNCYLIGDKRISKIKVLRNIVLLSDEEDLLDCVTYGSILNQNEYNTISENINSKKLKK